MTWSLVRLDWLTEVSRAVIDPRLLGDEVVVHYSIPALDVLGGPAVEPASSIASTKLRVRGGEVLVSKLNPRKLRVVIVRSHDKPAMASGEFIALLPKSIAPKFLSYWLQSERTRQDLDGATQSVTRSHQRVTPDVLTKKWLTVPSLAEQRAIADYLDTETARIDTLIAKKEALYALVEQRTRMFISDITSGNVDRHGHWQSVRLRYAIDAIVDSEHSTAPQVDGADNLVVRTANVKGGRLVTEGAIYTDAESYRRWTRRARPQPGDVLFTREAPAGESCLVPSTPRVCLGQRMVLFKVDEDVMRGSWLLHSLYSGPAQRFVQLLSQGSTVAHLNMSDIRDIPLLLPPLKEQDRWLAQIEEQVAWSRTVREKLERQVTLLTEHRQALITAAVTGELEVPGVAA